MLYSKKYYGMVAFKKIRLYFFYVQLQVEDVEEDVEEDEGVEEEEGVQGDNFFISVTKKKPQTSGIFLYRFCFMSVLINKCGKCIT